MKARSTNLAELRAYHPTPIKVVDRFARRVVTAWRKTAGASKEVAIADLFAGDGRLGRAVARLLEKRGYRPKVTFVEIDRRRLPRRSLEHTEHWHCRDVLEWRTQKRFDIVVANPPYLALTIERANVLGINWRDAINGGRNLYGVAALKCVAACSPGGIVGLIGPFAWARGYLGGPFRTTLRARCKWVRVSGFVSRSIFSGVHHDAGMTVCSPGRRAGGGRIVVNLNSRRKRGWASNPGRVSARGFSVRCGSIVWNRSKRFLTRQGPGSIPLIYGGNIGREGRIRLGLKRYADRQRIFLHGLAARDIVTGPALLVRRVMRGRPGAWRVDACVLENGSRVAVENHVIVVTPASGGLALAGYRRTVANALADFFAFSGQPSISVRLARSVMARVLGSERTGAKEHAAA